MFQCLTILYVVTQLILISLKLDNNLKAPWSLVLIPTFIVDSFIIIIGLLINIALFVDRRNNSTPPQVELGFHLLLCTVLIPIVLAEILLAAMNGRNAVALSFPFFSLYGLVLCKFALI